MKNSLLILLVLPLFLAATIPPPTQKVVSDFAEVLSADAELKLQNQILTIKKDTSFEIAIVTVIGLEDLPIAQYGVELAQSWGIGKKDKDNGILFLIAPNERSVNISTGYGAEGVLPDILAKRIISENLAPYFVSGDFFTGLSQALTRLSPILSGEGEPEPVQSRRRVKSASDGDWLRYVIVFILFIFAFIFRLVMPGSRYRTYGSRRSRILSTGGGFGGGGGGFGGGGFGGFGGGSFGGGGASGSW